MTGALTEVAAGAPEALFFPIFQPAGDFIVQQVRGISGLENVTLIGADGLFVSDFLAIPETVGMYFSGPDLDFEGNASETGVTGNDFLSTYEARYGEEPAAAFWAHSYDATVMLLTAIDQVAVDVDGTLYIDRQALRDALTATSDFSGIIGKITCDAFGDCGAQRISVVVHAGDPNLSGANVLYQATRADLIDLITG